MSVTKTLLRKGFIIGARYSGLAAALTPVLAGQGAILMLHRIGPCSNALCINGFLSVREAFLDELLDDLKRSGFLFVSMDEVVDRLKAGHDDERFLSITLDDGYRDNLERAVPLFEAHDIPYTIFVCPGFIEGSAHLWWENLAEICERQPAVSVPYPGGEKTYACRSAMEKRQAYLTIMDRLCNDVDEFEQRMIVDAMCAHYGIDPTAHVRDAIMGWDELQALSKTPLCTIGAHTLNHYHLRRLDEDVAVTEVEQSAKIIGERLGGKPDHFAYPYGAALAVGEREVRIAAAAGFSSAVTTRHGVLHSAHAETLHALPRISINGNYQRVDYVKTMLSGIAVPFANAGRRVVTL